MKPEIIGKAYDQITGLWQRKGFDRNNGIGQHKRALQFAKNKGNALDIGCGCTGRFIDLLLESGFAPEGVDISQNMLAIARVQHPDIPFYHEDICAWRLPHHYDFITAWDSFWHIPLAKQAEVLRKLLAALHQEGVLIFSFGGLDKPNEHTDHTMGPEVYYATLGIKEYLKLVDEMGGVCRHLEFDQYPELHAYMIVQKIK